MVPETNLVGLDPFHTAMLCSYALVNDQFYWKNKSLSLPINLWGHPLSKSINKQMVNSFMVMEYFMVADLPLIRNKIDYGQIQKVASEKSHSVFLCCYALQSKFSKYFGNIIAGSHLVLEDLVNQSKNLL